MLTSLLDESAERITQLRAYRWTIEIVFRWLKRGLQLDTLIRVSPKGVERQVAVAVIVYGVLLQYHQGGALSLTALRHRVRTEVHRALVAAGIAEGERRARARAAEIGRAHV